MKKKYFKDKQQFNNIEIIGILVFSMALLIFSMINGLQNHHWAFTYMEWSTLALLLILGGYLWYLTHLSLHVSLTEEGIVYKMKPLHLKKRKIPWQMVANCEVISTPRLAQWHGGNITFNHEQRFTLSGRTGLHITTVDGREYFLGTKRVNELKDAVEKVMAK
jgi:hypothetical protein